MDVIKEMQVSYYSTGRDGKLLKICFDNGSPYTFIKKSSVTRIGKTAELPDSRIFHGLGDGTFQSSAILHLYIKILDIWCAHTVYVVEDRVLEDGYEILTGHDFMQLYGIKVVPHKGDIEIDEARLRLSQRIR